MKRAAAALLISLFPALARAQPAAQPAPEPEGTPGDSPAAAPTAAAANDQVVEVRVIGSKADGLRRTPGSGTIVSEKEIKRAQPTDPAEMIQRITGMTARQSRDGGNRLDLSVRGFDAPRGRFVLLMEDGVPLTLNPYGEPDLYFGPPIDRVRAIEVVKGSGSILFGPQTLGAVVNFLTIAPPPQREVTLEIDGGVPAYGKVLGRYGDAIGDGGTRYVAQILHERGEGWRDEPFEGTDFLGKVSFATSQRGEATVKVSLHDEIDHSTQAGLTREMFAADPKRPTVGPHDVMHIKKYDAALIHEVLLGESTSLRTLVFAYTTLRIWRTQIYQRSASPGEFYERVVGDPRIPGGALFYKHSDTINDRSFDVAGIEPRIEQRFATGRMHHTLQFGARLLGESAHRQQRTGDNSTSDVGDVDTDETSFTYAISAYTQDKIAATDWLILTPGLRFEFARSTRNLRRLFDQGESKDVSVEGKSDVDEFIPGTGIIVGSKDNHAFGGLHIGFAPPRVATAINDAGVDAQLDAERSINYELGTRLSPRRWFHFETTGFLSSYQNQVIPSAGPNARAELTNAGATTHYGVETATSFRIGEALRLPLGVDVGARYTFSHASFAAGGNKGHLLPYAPLHTGGATLDLDYTSGLGGQVAVTFIGAQFTDEENTLEEDAGGRVGRIDTHAIVDLAARYHHQRTGLTGKVSVKNVGDAVYVSTRRPDGIFPGTFREVILGLRWDYEAKSEP